MKRLCASIFFLRIRTNAVSRKMPLNAFSEALIAGQTWTRVTGASYHTRQRSLRTSGSFVFGEIGVGGRDAALPARRRWRVSVELREALMLDLRGVAGKLREWCRTSSQ